MQLRNTMIKPIFSLPDRLDYTRICKNKYKWTILNSKAFYAKCVIENYGNLQGAQLLQAKHKKTQKIALILVLFYCGSK